MLINQLIFFFIHEHVVHHNFFQMTAQNPAVRNLVDVMQMQNLSQLTKKCGIRKTLRHYMM